MGTESQALEFDTEEARIEAMNGLDEHDPDNEVKLDQIMKAPIKAKAVEAERETPAEPPANKAESVEKKEATVSDPKPSESTGDDDVFTIKKSELPAGYDTIGKAFKSLQEKQELIERQTKFIKEKLGGQDPGLQMALERAKKAEEELAELRVKIEKPAKQETRDEKLTSIPESKAPKIKEIRQKLQELSKDPISNEDQIHSLRNELDDLWLAENERTSLMIERANQRAEAAERRVSEVGETAKKYYDQSKRVEDRNAAEEALRNEYKQMDTFANCEKYPEFKLSKQTAEVEREYIDWAAEVTRLFYGYPIDIQTDEGRKAMSIALKNLEKGGPDITEKCRVANVALQPSEDVKKYLEICDLMDYRDGWRIDPVTGKKELMQRYHAPTGKMVPDAFPSIESAYEDRRIRDGYYEKRIRESYSKGGKDIAEAVARRDRGAVEMDNAGGVSKKDAGLSISVEEAQKVVNQIDEMAAIRARKSGDPTLFNKLNQALKALGVQPLE